MISGTIPITSTEWTEIAGGATWVQVSGEGAQGFFLNFTESATPPNGNATRHFFSSHPNGFDFEASGYPDGQRIWAKSKADNDNLFIVRETQFYFLFIPDGFDSMLTSGGDTFKVRGNG